MNYVKLLFKLYQFKKNERKSREELLQLQEKRLRKIIKHAFKHSPYYQRVFKESGITIENINQLPITSFPKLDKAMFVENFNDIVIDSSLSQNDLQDYDETISLSQKEYKGKYHVVHSSGSTSKPTYYIYDDHAWEEMLIGILRAALWGMKTRDIVKLLINGPRIAYIAATDGRYGGAMAVGAGIEGIHAKKLFLDINLPVLQWINKIEEFQPNIIIGYPSAIKILAELVEKKEANVNVTRIISCGEPLNMGLRDYIEKVLQAPLINIYGSSESLAIGVETSSIEGMYLFDDMNYIEIEEGHIYLTSLYNYVQPLIRYQISDCLNVQESKKSTYPLTLIKNILGRNEDMMWFEDEMGNREFLHPLAIEGFTFEGMLDFQFHQIDKNAFEIFIQANDKHKKEEIENYMDTQMNKILYSKKMSFVQFKVKFVEAIYPDKQTGKKRLVITED